MYFTLYNFIGCIPTNFYDISIKTLNSKNLPYLTLFIPVTDEG